MSFKVGKCIEKRKSNPFLYIENINDESIEVIKKFVKNHTNLDLEHGILMPENRMYFFAKHMEIESNSCDDNGFKLGENEYLVLYFYNSSIYFNCYKPLEFHNIYDEISKN